MFSWPRAAPPITPGATPTTSWAPTTTCRWPWPRLLSSPTTTSRPTLKNALVIGVSQSGQSPDIVSVLAEGRRKGCPTLAITNDPASPLAQEADYVIDIQAGAEKAVAATKTYTAELMSIAMLSVALSGDTQRRAELEQVPSWASQIPHAGQRLARIAQRYRFVRQCVVLGRGFNYATAFEFSLKLKELTYTLAEPYSSADFMHGPIALIDQGFPVLAVAPAGPSSTPSSRCCARCATTSPPTCWSSPTGRKPLNWLIPACRCRAASPSGCPPSSPSFPPNYSASTSPSPKASIPDSPSGNSER